MEKYKNQDGIALNYEGDDSHKVLVREVIAEALKILSTYQLSSPQSMMWAMQQCEDFLRVNFSLVEKVNRSDEWIVEQYNRNRSVEDQITSVEDMK